MRQQCVFLLLAASVIGVTSRGPADRFGAPDRIGA